MLTKYQQYKVKWSIVLALIPPIIFVLFILYTAYIQVHFRLDFIMEATTMNPDQTAPKDLQ